MPFIVPKFVTKDSAWNASKDIDQKSAHFRDKRLPRMQTKEANY